MPASLWLATNITKERYRENEAKASSATREAIMTDLAENSLAVKDGAGAADTLEKCLKEFPKSDHRNEWILDLGHAYLLAEKKDKARKLLDGFIQQHSGSAESERAKALLDSIS